MTLAQMRKRIVSVLTAAGSQHVRSTTLGSASAFATLHTPNSHCRLHEIIRVVRCLHMARQSWNVASTACHALVPSVRDRVYRTIAREWLNAYLR